MKTLIKSKCQEIEKDQAVQQSQAVSKPLEREAEGNWYDGQNFNVFINITSSNFQFKILARNLSMYVEESLKMILQKV